MEPNRTYAVYVNEDDRNPTLIDRLFTRSEAEAVLATVEQLNYSATMTAVEAIADSPADETPADSGGGNDREAEENPIPSPGGDRRSEEAKGDQVDNVNLKPDGGNSQSYLARRLARDHPDILERMKAASPSSTPRRRATSGRIGWRG